MTATYMNYEGLRDAFPTIEIECYIQAILDMESTKHKQTNRANKGNCCFNRIKAFPIFVTSRESI
jgi:hypothetical protein